MKNQLDFTDIEYSNRRRSTKREEFLKKMDKVVPWDSWVEIIMPVYPVGKRGRRPIEIEKLLRMMLLQTWFNLSDEGVEDAIYDSYAMRAFMSLNFLDEQVPDATTLCKFRKLLNDNGIQERLFHELEGVLAKHSQLVKGGSIVDATIVESPQSKKNKDHQMDPEMHSVKKNTKWYYGMRIHVGVDAYYGYVHSLIGTAANQSEVKIAHMLLRQDDTVVYGDAGYLKMENYGTKDENRDYRINRQMGTFKRHYGDKLSLQEEKKLEKRKSHVRCKVEYIFHIVKDRFGWRKLRYKGIAKNYAHACVLFASANLYMLAFQA